MADDFDPYAPVIGMSLLSMSVMRSCVSFEFGDGDRDFSHNIRLSTSADLCLSESELFKSHSEYDIINPIHLKTLYSAIGKKVLDFKPLNKDRVCQMNFDEFNLYTWAGGSEWPDCLFEARKNPSSKNFDWWLIDDLP